MRFSNLHQHSTFSDGKNSAEEIVLSAIEKNMESIGFSDHFATTYELSNDYKVVTPQSYFDYYKEIQRLKEVYKNKIAVFFGAEADLYSNITNEKFDYLIGSVHYLEHNGKTYPLDHTAHQQDEYIDEVCNGDKLLFAKNYFEAIVSCIEKYKPDIIGHFDIITKFSKIDEENPTYQKLAIETLRKCLQITNLLEVNTGAISRGYRTIPYPAKFLLSEAKKLGAKIILSADSHNKDTVCYYFNESVTLLKEIGFTHISKLTTNGFIEEKIK